MQDNLIKSKTEFLKDCLVQLEACYNLVKDARALLIKSKLNDQIFERMFQVVGMQLIEIAKGIKKIQAQKGVLNDKN